MTALYAENPIGTVHDIEAPRAMLWVGHTFTTLHVPGFLTSESIETIATRQAGRDRLAELRARAQRRTHGAPLADLPTPGEVVELRPAQFDSDAWQND